MRCSPCTRRDSSRFSATDGAIGKGAASSRTGQPDVVGYVFPTPGLLAGLEPHVPTAPSARTGRVRLRHADAGHGGDVDRRPGSGRRRADRRRSRPRAEPAPRTPAAARPGHHVTRDAFGGSCYLNNSAVAAQHLRDRGVGRVAVARRRRPPRKRRTVDLLGTGGRAHGVGARRPGRRLVPPLPRLRRRARRGAGVGTNLNVPLPPGSGDAEWLGAVDALVDAAREHTERGARRPARGRRGRRRPQLAARGHGGRVPRGRAATGRARAPDRARPGGRLRPRDAGDARARGPRRDSRTLARRAVSSTTPTAGCAGSRPAWSCGSTASGSSTSSRSWILPLRHFSRVSPRTSG